jgi:tRNA(Ile)-lysidine synthase
MTAAVQDAAFAALDRRLDPTSTDPLAVAVSGGGDSMALMRLAAAWARGHARKLHVLTVDHGLQPDSIAWTNFVGQAAERLGLSVRALRWTGDKPEAGLPAAARAARHALLADAARHAGARVLLMGHTADDLLEAELMREEGSTVGAPGEWSPSPAWPEGRGLFVLRPLLKVRRAALRLWLGEAGERWIEDPANADPRFARGRARAFLAHNPDFMGPEVLTSKEDDQPPVGSHVQADPGGLLLVARGWLRELFDPTWVVYSAVTAAAGAASGGSFYKAFGLGLRLQQSPPVEATLGGARVRTQGDHVLFGREPGRRGLPSAPARAGESLVWDGRFEVEADEAGVIRPLAGAMARLSGPEREALKLLPGWVRPTLPVLETPDGRVRTVRKRCLVYDRMRGACGAFTREAELPRAEHGASPAEALSLGRHLG